MRRLLAMAVAAAFLLPGFAQAAEIQVEGDPSTALGLAIVAAEPGDTLILPAGVFLLTEGEVLQEKDLTLRGEGIDQTTIVPSGGGEALDDPGVELIGVNEAAPLQPEEAAQPADEESDDGGIETKAQIIALIATLAIFLFILDLVRRRRLAERYALLWMSAGVALLVLSIWTDGLERIADLMGIQEPANAIFILAFAVVFLLLLNFSVASSRLSEQTKILAQEVARLETDLRAQQKEHHAAITAQERPEDS